MFKKNSFLVALFVIALSVNSNGFTLIPDGGNYLAAAEVMPAPIGGLKAIYSKIVYPDIARKAGIEGKVYVIAYVNEQGNVEDVKVLKGIGGGCDQAAARAVKETKFTPGKVKGTPVKVKVALPIVFKLK